LELYTSKMAKEGQLKAGYLLPSGRRSSCGTSTVLLS
jgi:hypothetical protein